MFHTKHDYMMKFELYKESNNEYFFRMVVDREKILMSVSGYDEKETAIKGIESVKKNAPIPSSVIKQDSSDGGYFFTILNSSGKTVCISTDFCSPHLRDKWVNDIQKELPQLDIFEV